MKLTLTRQTLGADFTTGILQVGSNTFFTIEQPWKENLKGHSCVPTGTYELHPHNSPKHPHVWALHNPELNVYAEPGPDVPETGRTDCLIHPANWAWQLEGCIAPGTGRSPSDKGPMVLHSQDAVKQIQAILGIGSTGHTLEIL